MKPVKTGKNRPVQLLKTDRQKPVRTGRFNFIDRSGPDRTGYNSAVPPPSGSYATNIKVKKRT
jgi:hypothetical protein